MAEILEDKLESKVVCSKEEEKELKEEEKNTLSFFDQTTTERIDQIIAKPLDKLTLVEFRIMQCYLYELQKIIEKNKEKTTEEKKVVSVNDFLCQCTYEMIDQYVKAVNQKIPTVKQIYKQNLLNKAEKL